MARPHRLDDQDLAKAVAAAYVEGWSNQQMCDEFAVKDKHTISRWVKDPRVKAHATRLAQDRVLRILRRTDHIIESRLQNTDEIETADLLRLRKEFLGGGTLKVEVTKPDEATTDEVMDDLEKDPELAGALSEWLRRESAND
jgi:hypothetical protein